MRAAPGQVHTERAAAQKCVWKLQWSALQGLHGSKQVGFWFRVCGYYVAIGYVLLQRLVKTHID